MKKWLYLVLIRKRIQTYRKYATFLVAFFLSLFVVNSVQASAIFPASRQAGKNITVQAVVPLTEEFTYSIKKNSTVSTLKSAFLVDEEIVVTVKIVGGNHEALRKHSVIFRATNVHGEEVFTASGETNNDGLAQFVFTAEEIFLGTILLQMADVTYSTMLVLQQTLSILIYQMDDARKEQSKAIKSPIGSGQIVSISRSRLLGTQPDQETNIFRNSGTIEVLNATFLFSRAGPNDS